MAYEHNNSIVKGLAVEYTLFLGGIPAVHCERVKTRFNQPLSGPVNARMENDLVRRILKHFTPTN